MTNSGWNKLALTLAALATIGAAACKGRGAGDDGPAGAAAGEGAMPSAMPGMEGMQGMQEMGGGMMDRMQAHMDMMQGATGADSMQRMLPMHRQMTANMIAEMNREMRGMNMSGDAAWTALMDSVRQDLRDLPEMSAAQVAGVMPAHRDRVLRLMGMHRDMMRQMK